MQYDPDKVHRTMDSGVTVTDFQLQAYKLQEAYHASRITWCDDPENGLAPLKQFGNVRCVGDEWEAK